MANVQKDLGPVSAYAIAVKHGYNGTEEEWAALQIAAAENAAAAAQAAKAAADTLEAVEETVNQETAQAVQAVKDQETASIESVEAAASAAGAAQEAAIAAKGAETLESIPSEYAALAEQVNQNTAALLTKAPAIECEASGSLVTVTDAAAQPAVQLVTHIEPVQDGEGDPSPDNVRPISGWDEVTARKAGHNLANWAKITSHEKSGIKCTNNKDGTFTLEGTSTEQYNGYQVDVKIKPGRYYVDAGNALLFAAARIERNGSTTYPSRSFVIYGDETAVSVYFGMTAGRTISGVVRPQLKIVNDFTTFEPYCGQTLTADLPETVYGGTVDWGTGVLTVTHKHDIFDGSEDERWSDGFYGNVVSKNEEVAIAGEDELGVIACSCAKPITANDRSTVTSPSIHARPNENGFDLRNMGTTAEELRNKLAITPMQIVYKLANPYTIQLTPQQLSMLRGTTNLWSDTGDTDLVYVADTKSYIDNKIAAIAAAIVNGSPTA